MIKKIAHIGLTVSNLERSISFYKDVLKFNYVGQMVMNGPSTERLFNQNNCSAKVAYLQSDKSSPLIELIEFVNVPIIKEKSSLFKTSISELCFYVDDIYEEYNRLKLNGVNFISEPQQFDSTSYGFSKSIAVYFYDPDGNIIELMQDL